MSCTEFEKLVTDLADDRLMDAVTRRRLQHHADECQSCAGRLTAERTLSARLDALADETEHESASPTLKTELLAAFAKLHTPERNFVIHTAPQRNFPYWQLAAAAAVILAVISGALLMRGSSTPTEIAKIEAAPSASPVVTPAATPALMTEQAKVDVTPSQAVTRSNRVRTMRARSERNEIAALAQETTTEYLPLTYMSDQTALQTGVVVRVEIPRATLLSMGLPMNTDRGNTLVKADVVVGDDGVPRAIRLVQ